MLLRFLRRPSDWKAAHSLGDENQLIHQAQRHGLSGVVHHQLHVQSTSLSLIQQRQLEHDARSIAAGTLRVKLFLLRALDALNASQVVPLILKGYGLAERIYPDPLLRSMSDVDLLVSGKDLPRAFEALSTLKMNRADAEAERYVREHSHDLKFWNASGMIELHCRLFTGMGCTISTEEALQFVQPAILENRSVCYLAPEYEFAYLALHATSHLFQRLIWLYDLKLFIEVHPSFDWSEVERLGKLWGTSVALYTALELAARYLDAPVPPIVLERMRHKLWQSTFERSYFTEKRLLSAPSGDHGRQTMALNLLLIDGNLRKIRFGAHHTWHGLRRKLAGRFPNIAPHHWRG